MGSGIFSKRHEFCGKGFLERERGKNYDGKDSLKKTTSLEKQNKKRVREKLIQVTILKKPGQKKNHVTLNKNITLKKVGELTFASTHRSIDMKKFHKLVTMGGPRDLLSQACFFFSETCPFKLNVILIFDDFQ